MANTHSTDTKNSAKLLRRLLERGDSLAIVNGKLEITPRSGRPVPAQWLREHAEQLVKVIAQLCQRDMYQYLGFTAGLYGEHRSGGVHLQFINLYTGEPYYTIFNVQANRARSTTYGQKSQPLPGNKFRVTKTQNFYLFWVSTGLPMPPRLSSFHDYMGKFKGIVFDGQQNIKNKSKLVASSMRPLAITHQEISAAFGTVNPDNCRTNPGQLPDNSRTIYPDKQTPQTHTGRGLASNSGACAKSYGISNQGNADKGYLNNVIPLSKDPTLQSTKEWLDDYNRNEKQGDKEASRQ